MCNVAEKGQWLLCNGAGGPIVKKAIRVLAVLIPTLALAAVGFVFVHGAGASGSSCTATGFSRDNINLTAALVNPKGTVSGEVNAAGCNIGVYYGSGAKGTVDNATIHNANYFGVVNNGGAVDILNSNIHDIGEHPLNGSQHGVGVYFAIEGGATGKIEQNHIWNYQKGGIVVNGVGTKATISHNTVLGQGAVNYIAQNGIQIGYGAKATVSYNIVQGNSYSGAGDTASGGIIVVGGSCYSGALSIGSTINHNIVVGNDIGVWLSNLDGNTCVPTLTPTKIKANNNVISYDAVNNTTGNGPGAGYQAGIADQGDADMMDNNGICGVGYTPVTPPPYLYFIDLTVTNSPTATGNYSCLNGSPISASMSALNRVQSHRHAVVAQAIH